MSDYLSNVHTKTCLYIPNLVINLSKHNIKTRVPVLSKLYGLVLYIHFAILNLIID